MSFRGGGLFERGGAYCFKSYELFFILSSLKITAHKYLSLNKSLNFLEVGWNNCNSVLCGSIFWEFLEVAPHSDLLHRVTNAVICSFFVYQMSVCKNYTIIPFSRCKQRLIVSRSEYIDTLSLLSCENNKQSDTFIHNYNKNMFLQEQLEC